MILKRLTVLKNLIKASINIRKGIKMKLCLDNAASEAIIKPHIVSNNCLLP
jgi:hypothetical protein